MVIFIYRRETKTYYKLSIYDEEQDIWACHFIKEDIYNALKDKVKCIEK